MRRLSGTGTVSYNTTLSPPIPITVPDLDVGTLATVRLYLNIPTTVTKFSLTETGTMQDSVGTAYSISLGQAVIP